MKELVLLFTSERKSTERMLVCPSEDVIIELLAGRLQLSQAAGLHQHIETCPACGKLLAELGRSGEEAGDDPLPFVDPEHYYIDGQFARGGLGRILKARDRRLGRVVAIKQLLVDDPSTRARFRREALVTARLQHPAIIPVYEAGRWPSGEPFYAMKLVAGRSLGDVIDEARTLDERLALLPKLIAVSDAMAYAHAEDVIHRDLKPANILVGQFGETVIIDWGLAKLVGDATPRPGTPEAADDLSLAGAVMGTPAYMCPEQARGNEIDARADVYALGAVIYHVLTGTAPYRGSAREVLEDVLAGPPPPIELGAPGAPRELSAIVDRAMAREAAGRYPSAGALAEDLRRFVTGQLVRAHRYSSSQLLRRWLKRHQLATVTLLVLLVSGTVGLWRVIQERNRAEAARTVAETSRADLMLMQAKSWLDRDPTTAVGWLKSYLAAGGPPGPAWPIAAELVGRGVAAASFPGLHTRSLAAEGPRLATSSGRGLVRVIDLEGRSRLLRGSPNVDYHQLVFTPDGKKLIGTSDRGTSWWDVESAELHTVAADVSLQVTALSRDSRELVLNEFPEGGLWRVDLTTGAYRRAGKPRFGWESFYDRQGHLISLDSDDERVLSLDDLDTGHRRVLQVSDGEVRPSSDGGFLLVSGDGNLRLWDLTTGRVRMLPVESPHQFALAPNARQAAWTGAAGLQLSTWDPATGERHSLPGHEAPLTELEYAPKGLLLASASADGTVRLSTSGEGAARVLVGHRGSVFTQFSSDGSMLRTSATDDSTVRMWRVNDVPQVLLQAEVSLRRMAVSHGRAAVWGEGFNQLWDVATKKPQPIPVSDTPAAFAFSPDGNWLAASHGAEISLCPKSGACQTLLSEGAVADLEFSADGGQLAAAGEGGARVWDLRTRAEHTLAEGDATLWDLAFSPDGKQLALAGLDQRVQVWDPGSGRRRFFDGHEAPVSRVAFSPDGKQLVSGGRDQQVWLWDVTTGQGRVLFGLSSPVSLLAFAPDGRSVAAADAGRRIKLFDLAAKRTRLLAGPEGPILDMVFSPDGRMLATASEDRSIWVWDAHHAHPAQILRGHAGQVNQVRFDGDELWSASDDGTVRSWKLTPALGANDQLASWLRRISSVEIDGDGRAATRIH